MGQNQPWSDCVSMHKIEETLYRVFGFVTIQEVRQEIFMKALSSNQCEFPQENSPLALVSTYLSCDTEEAPGATDEASQEPRVATRHQPHHGPGRDTER